MTLFETCKVKWIEVLRRYGGYSLPDWAFLPLSLLVGGGFVVLALEYRPAFENPTFTETGFVMREAALGQLIPGLGTRMELISGVTGQPIARLSSVASFETAGMQSAGVGASLIGEWEERVAGRMLRVEVDAMPGSGSRVEHIRVGYFTTGFGDSERSLVALGSDWKIVGICFAVPENAEPNGHESVGVWPGDEGNANTVLVREIRITIEPEDTSLDVCRSRIGARGSNFNQ